MTNILVTGANGFIGRHIINKFLKKKEKYNINKIYAIDNNIYSLNNFFNDDSLIVIKGDICDYNLCEKFVKRVDHICHQAAISSIPIAENNIINTMNVNICGTINLLNAFKFYNKKGKFIYASSSADSTKSFYGMTKKTNEDYSNLFYNLYGIKTIGLKYFNVYGNYLGKSFYEWDSTSLIPNVISKIKNNKTPIIYGDGESKRDFIHVNDISDLNVQLIFKNLDENIYGKSFEIGTGKSTSVNEIIDLLKNKLNLEFETINKPRRIDDVDETKANITEIQKYIEFDDCIDIVDGINSLNI